MRRAFGTLTVCLVSGLLLGGCVDNSSGLTANRSLAPRDSVSIYDLAGALGLTVESASPCGATLRNSSNAVMIYPDPAGQAYVNGVPVGQVGGIRVAGNNMFIPRATVDAIRPALRRVNRPAAPTILTASYETPRRSLGRVVVDAGHGGDDPGAISVLGVQEKAITLAAARDAASLLSGGSDVVMTRCDDDFVELEERAAIANRTRADLFVSFHADSARNASASGYTLYVARAASPDALRLARAIERRLDALGVESRGIRRADYRVLVRTNCPAVLVEMGYLSNRTEAARLSRPSYRRAIAAAVADGVMDYLR